MKQIVFVSIGRTQCRFNWNGEVSDDVYYSDFFDTKEEIDAFIEQIKKDYPDSNLVTKKYNSKYHIKYVVLLYDPKDTTGLLVLKEMLRAKRHYNDRTAI